MGPDMEKNVYHEPLEYEPRNGYVPFVAFFRHPDLLERKKPSVTSGAKAGVGRPKASKPIDNARED